MPAPAHPYQTNQRRRPQSGVVLIVVMIMLVVIGMVSAVAMRSALTADQISNNARLENLAKQAAQIALRYCEGEVIKDEPGVSIYPAPAATETQKSHWELYANWSADSGVKAATVPESYMKAADGYVPATRPQCLAELSLVNPALRIITARGFGPDYVATNTGGSGAVVWLQSIISVQN